MTNKAKEPVVLNDDVDDAAYLKAEQADADAAADTNEGIVHNDDGSKTITLLYPVTVKQKVAGGATTESVLTEITLRRPLTGDLVAITNFKNEGEQARQLFIRLSNHPQPVVDKIDAEDFMRASEVIEGFLRPSRRAGKGSSAQ